jgi:hypothetical protein
VLSLKGVLQQVSHIIRQFLWKGDKTNSKKFHLVNWSMVKETQEHGGIDNKGSFHHESRFGRKNNMETDIKKL